jgi:hypothetical protein
MKKPVSSEMKCYYSYDQRKRSEGRHYLGSPLILDIEQHAAELGD